MRVAYLSYDGALDPLGSTQVVPYLEGLAGRGVKLDLMSFEKPARLADGGRRRSMAARLSRAGIAWHPLRYHKSPRLPATLFDILHGALNLRRLARVARFDIFHCRGEITPIMVRLSGLPGPLLLDMRGFFADERVDAGSWPPGSLLDRGVRFMEGQNLRRAARVIVLTERGRDVLVSRGVTLPIDVIPTCVDDQAFAPPSPRGEAAYDLVYFGSLGGWYLTNEMLNFVDMLRESSPAVRVLFLTNNPDRAATARLGVAAVTVQSVAPEEVPGWLAKCRATFFFIRASPSKMASCPTKLAEALAMGLPVLTGPGVGDVDALLRDEKVGVVLEDFSRHSFVSGWSELCGLLADPAIQERCRSVALRLLSLGLAVDRYESAYKGLASESAIAPPERLTASPPS